LHGAEGVLLGLVVPGNGGLISQRPHTLLCDSLRQTPAMPCSRRIAIASYLDDHRWASQVNQLTDDVVTLIVTSRVIQTHNFGSGR